jgi:hypothetical protein
MPLKFYPVSEQLKYHSAEEMQKTRDREVENADKQLANLLFEYQKVL